MSYKTSMASIGIPTKVGVQHDKGNGHISMHCEEGEGDEREETLWRQGTRQKFIIDELREPI